MSAAMQKLHGEARASTMWMTRVCVQRPHTDEPRCRHALRTLHRRQRGDLLHLARGDAQRDGRGGRGGEARRPTRGDVRATRCASRHREPAAQPVCALRDVGAVRAEDLREVDAEAQVDAAVGVDGETSSRSGGAPPTRAAAPP